ncbi:MAG: GNAT family N-acetyltransferase [Thermoguttaceae bacterium]|jgi:CelD/BcsL family acetyltransferase involved in cellulose biosynthesis
MRIEAIPAVELTADQLSLWSQFQRADATLDSPYFRPEFTQAVAAVRSGVEVGILKDGVDIVGFFPFQRGKGNAGLPVGGKMSVFQGLIARQGVNFNPQEIVKACGLSAWHFDHLIAGQESFRPYHWRAGGSPYMDLSGGWNAYEKRQLAEHKIFFKQMRVKSRQAEHKIGKIRLDFQGCDDKAFSSMIEWKHKQYQNTGVTDILAVDWTVALLQRILTCKQEPFSGILSALYINDILAAVLLSMKSYGVLHGWFSAHGPEFARFSPGLMLWIELAKVAEKWGIGRIDLGKGPEDYKRHIMSDTIAVAEGSVDTRPLGRIIRRHWHRVFHWLRNTPLRKPLLTPGRFVRRIIETKNLQ